MKHRKQKGRSRSTHKESPLEVKLREWKALISTDSASEPLQGNEMVQFLETADELAATDVERRQIVISKLASQGGLRRIVQLINMLTSENTCQGSMQSAILSLLYVIGNTEVLRSAILEPHVTAIYKTICGKDGSPALGLFAATGEPDALPLEDLEIILAVIAHILMLVDPTSLVDGYQSTIRCLEEKVNLKLDGNNGATAVNTQIWLNECKARLLTKLSIPSLSSKMKTRFGSSKDGLNDTPTFGHRHDNDFADIRQIRIFPTFQEVMSKKEPYLPGLDPTHFHLSGPDGLLDRHFRLYREDAVGDMRDTIQNIVNQQRQPALRSKVYSNTSQFHSYQNLMFQRLMCDRWEGLVITVSIDQPREVQTLTPVRRAEWWNSSGRLQPGVLVCLLDFTGHVIFCMVGDQRHRFNDENSKDAKVGNDLSQDLSSNPCKATVSLSLADSKDITRIANFFSGSDHRRTMILLEFPKMIPQTFQPTLAALQSMVEKDNLPFADLLAPKTLGIQEVAVNPPIYSQTKKFRFNLSCLLSNDQSLEFSPEGTLEIEKLRQGSTLDARQSEALVHALTRRLALLQGPPGTGKSFISVSLLRILLATKNITNLGPILVVTYTNHALDQTLEHCLEQGIYNVVRIGSRSKSERLENMNLRAVARGAGKTEYEKKEGDARVKALTAKAGSVNEAIRSMFEPKNAVDLNDYLKSRHPEFHKQLWTMHYNGAQKQHQTFQLKSNPVASWLENSPRGDSNPKGDALKLLNAKPEEIWKMSQSERRCIYNFWMKDYKATRKEVFFSAMNDYHDAKKLDDAARQEVDLRCLAKADIIGMTTSGLARNLDLLRRIPMKVVLVEEAGEILEAHTLTALLPDIEHAILIGDHLQLKPSVERFHLTSESQSGKKYSLDISLFERLVSPPTAIPSIKLPCSTLGTQRRMRPSISSLIRQTLYPHLEDDPSVQSYPDVAGMKDCLYWLDHSNPESGRGEIEPASMSKSNDYEIECVVGLATHLLLQGVYQPNDIAVITPYLGQMFRLKTALSAFTEVVLDDRDQGRLQQAGFFFDEPTHTEGNGTKETNFLDALKVATVDNFQGEEARVVIVSLVRSNKNNQCGFLKTPNRINVLLSRAKHGMYIIGNSRTSAGVPMWAKVLDILEEQGNIGKSLKLRCPRHPNTALEVFEPADFRRLAPEGGCTLPCGRLLECGHACNQLCHSDMRHNNVKCDEPCERMKAGCDHPCQWLCGEPCEPKCMELLQGTITLDCGHTIYDVRCWQRQDQSSLKCDVMLEKRIDRCGHTIKVPCYQDVQDPDFMDCDAVCGGRLKKCGHFCQAPCFACPIYDDGTRNHAACYKCNGY